jgi:oxygen-independent coproporphyrinogen III oxidase
MPSYSLYLHIPFCRHRCSYCDFNTYAGLDSLIPEYVEAMCIEIEQLALSAGERLPVHTIFFGGGTPSLLPSQEFARIMGTIDDSFDLQPRLEATLEANPGTVSFEYLRELRALGINRISLGMQSADLEELHLLEREHDFKDVIQAVDWARAAGFSNLNLDLIYGLPLQRLETWEKSLDKAIALNPEHLSLYALTIEHGTPLKQWVGKGLVQELDPDLSADMYEFSSEKLEASGFQQYEISNWASTSPAGGILSCRHNIQYWRNLPYLGVGAGAHGFAAGIRTANVLSPAAYIKRCHEGKQDLFPRTPAVVEATPVDKQAEMGETMMMGLRLTREGVSDKNFARRFGISLRDAYGREINRLLKLELLEWENEDTLRLTPRGRLLGNQVFMEFI